MLSGRLFSFLPIPYSFDTPEDDKIGQVVANLRGSSCMRLLMRYPLSYILHICPHTFRTFTR